MVGEEDKYLILEGKSMKQKFLDKIQVFIMPLCFLMFLGLDVMFGLLYCGGISDTALLFDGLWSLLFTGLLVLLPITIRRIGIILLTGVFSFICVLHAVMYNLFGTFFAFSDLSYTGDGMAFFSVDYLNVRKLLIISVVGCIFMSIFLAVVQQKKKYTWKNAALGIGIMVLAVVGIGIKNQKMLGEVNTSMGWNVLAEANAEADIYQNMSNKNYAMSMTGIYQYMYRSFMVSSGFENKLNYGDMYKELDTYFTSLPEEVHEKNEMTDIFKGKNAFFIMLESIDTWMLTEKYMPNLYRMQQESIDFTNHYSPLYISAGTFNTEFIANTSLIPPTNGVDTKVYMDNKFPYSIANCFVDLGYTANSFHGSNPHIYNRGAIHKNLGYAKYHNWYDMEMEEYRLDSQMINGYELMANDAPFFSFIITYSGHGPYGEDSTVISSKHIDAAREVVGENFMNVSEKDWKEYTYAISHAMETDEFIGLLMERLEADGILEDTVLVFFTDHYGKYMTNHEFVKEMKGVENTDMLCETPFFIYHSGTDAQVVETISSTVDILPTLANMFGLKTDYRYYTGVDVFSNEEHYVVFQGNNWYDGEIYFSMNYEGDLTDEIKTRNQEIVQMMKRSEYILKSDYFSCMEK